MISFEISHFFDEKAADWSHFVNEALYHGRRDGFWTDSVVYDNAKKKLIDEQYSYPVSILSRREGYKKVKKENHKYNFKRDII